MGLLTLYAIKSALCLAVLYLPFTLLLRRETFFSFNRYGLLFIVLLSLILPCLNVPLWDLTILDLFERQRQAVVEIGLPIAMRGTETHATITHVEAGGSMGWNWARLLVAIYMIGLIICLVLKARQYFRLVRFIPSGCLWTDRHDGVTIYCHAGEQGAFSWMRSIVVNEADSAADSPVMLHEMAHVRHRHSWDALFVAFVEVLQWFNPCIWMLDISLREIHEYEADDAVLRRGVTARNYQLLLIKNAVCGSRYTFANAFNHSLLKKRITMMMKKKSSKWARMRLLYVLPATLIVLGAFASHHFTTQTATLSNESSHLSLWGNAASIIKPTDNLETQQKAIEAAEPSNNQKPFALHVVTDEYGRITGFSPEGDNIPGRVFPVGNIFIDGREATYEEAVNYQSLGLEVFEIIYTPNQAGTAKYNYKEKEGVVNFKSKAAPMPNTLSDTSTVDITNGHQVYEVAEVMPQYPGGMSELMRYLSTSVKYPKIAQDYGVQGRCLVTFIVTKEGKISDVKLAKGPEGETLNQVVLVGYKPSNEADSLAYVKRVNQAKARQALEEEAIKVVKAMPDWKPGYQKNQPVNCRFTLPITFRLQ